MRTTSIIALFCLLTSSAAQDNKLPMIRDHVDGTHCETTKADFDFVAQAAGQDDTIIIIARLGDGENSRSANRRRLKDVREYLESTRGLAKDRLVVAEGERARGLGQVDIYVGGKLLFRFTLNWNRDFFRGCST